MVVTIEIADQTARALTAQAQACGLSLEEYLRRVAEGAPVSAVPGNGSAEDAARDFDAALDELFAGDSRKLPRVPLTYTREDLYSDHD